MERIYRSMDVYDRLFGQTSMPDLIDSDPEWQTAVNRFLFGEVFSQGNLTEKTRELIALAVLTAEQGTSQIPRHVIAALRVGATPIEIKEAVYQCTPYVGFPKVFDALAACNQTLQQQGISLPLSSQGTVTEEDRLAKGIAVQKSIFGPTIDQMRAAAPEQQKHIQDNLSAFCFGDFYTRQGLDLQLRELLTFCIVSALGGCDPQVKAHVQGNANVGNGKAVLVAALTQCLPFIGFPKTLNALAAINQVLPDEEN